MIRQRLGHFERIWALDAEYVHDDGEVPEPVCIVAVDLFSNERVALWYRDMSIRCPFDTGPNTLFVLFAGTGDIACFLELDWPVPQRIVDLHYEVKQRVYDSTLERKASLIQASHLYQIPTMETAAKESYRHIIIDRDFTDADRHKILWYCAEDATITGQLFVAMLPELTQDCETWSGVLFRGRYTPALSRMARVGVPIAVQELNLAKKHWEEIKRRLVFEVEAKHRYGIYIGTSFSEANFAAYLQGENIPWPLTESGEHLDLQDATFRKQAELYPQIRPLRELRHVMSGMRLSDYRIGKDGRNRVHLAPFCSVTGRNQPSNSRFIFGSARWSRSFIQPPLGRALAYCDWSAQEIAVSAAVSGDERMWESYASGDPYLDFAKRIGMVPPNATKKTHKRERSLCKAIVLGTNYGRGAPSIAQVTKMPLSEARELLQRHKEIYRDYWRFVENLQDAACLGLPVRTPFDWVRQAKPGIGSLNRRSWQNWPAQATAAEMMRLAACVLTESEILVCCPVHDAFLVESAIDEIENTVVEVRRIMEDASEYVLGETKIVRVDADIIRHPDSYRDENAGDFYEQVMALATELEAEGTDEQADAPSNRDGRRKNA